MEPENAGNAFELHAYFQCNCVLRVYVLKAHNIANVYKIYSAVIASSVSNLNTMTIYLPLGVEENGIYFLANKKY